MTARTESEIDAFVAPSADGELLVWPRTPGLREAAEANRRQLRKGGLRLLDRPIEALSPNRAETRLVFMTGHQPEFFHPGVWAKNVAAVILAGATGGEARFLVVDSDVPHQVALRWPDCAAPYCQVRTAAASPRAEWRSYEFINGETEYAAMFAALPEAFRSSPDRPFRAFMGAFLGDASDEEPSDQPMRYVERWTRGIEAAEAAMGARAPAPERISTIFGTGRCSGAPAAATFAGHLILEADAISNAYNTALGEYRRRRRIRGRQHPIPDLQRLGDRLEMPFWLVHPDRPRERLAVSGVQSGERRLWAGQRALGSVSPAALRRDPAAALSQALCGWRIRPRALAQTMYARLLACDLFIHGIGGAKYDQITDGIIRRFFGVEPPAYACVSATLRLALRSYDITEADLANLRHGARDLRYNPQRYVVDGEPASEVQAVLHERRRAIEASDRLRAERPRDRAARRAAFERIHRANAALLRASPGVVEAAARRLREAAAKLENDRVARSREWFFALYPKTALERLREAIRAALRSNL